MLVSPPYRIASSAWITYDLTIEYSQVESAPDFLLPANAFF
jgi:hypothetical protein